MGDVFNRVVGKLPKGQQKALRAIAEDGTRFWISALVLLSAALLMQFDVLRRFELVTYDYRCIVRGDRPADPRVVVVEISDDSISKIGRWPWDRDWHATLIKVLTELGAKAVAFDVIFAEPSDPKKDEVLAASVKTSGLVYLAEVIEESSKGPSLLGSIPSISGPARGTGHINLQPDIDGVMRRIPFFMEGGKGPVPQLSLAVAADELGIDLGRAVVRPGLARLPYKAGGSLNVPLDRNGNFIINWTGRWKDSYEHYSYIDVIASYTVFKKGGLPPISTDAFKGKLIYVGTTASGLFDIRPTPLEPSYPAVGVNLTVLNNLLEKRFIREVSRWQHLLVLLLLALLLYRIMKLQSYMKAALLTLGTLVGYAAVAVALFAFGGLWLNMIYPSLLITATYFCVTLYNQLSVAIEKAKLMKLATRDSLTGLFNIGHFKLLLKAEITTVSLRREKSLSLIMGDVDNFKKTNDTYGHLTGDMVLREVAQAVRSNCRALDVAARYGGEEFILMLPGANVDQAVKVAENIRKAIEAKVFFNEKGDFQTSISIGVTQVSPDDKDIDAIVARADRALYDAKHTGKNRVVVAADSPRVMV